METLQWLQDTSIGAWILNNSWLYYGLLAVHAIGMAAIVGGSLMLSFRILGFARGAPLSDFLRIQTVAWVGFLLNAASGALLFATNGTQLIVLWTFQLKMACIVAGGFFLWLLWRQVDPVLHDADHVFDSGHRTTACCVILFWIGAIVSGRYIAYTLPVG